MLSHNSRVLPENSIARKSLYRIGEKNQQLKQGNLGDIAKIQATREIFRVQRPAGTFSKEEKKSFQTWSRKVRVPNFMSLSFCRAKTNKHTNHQTYIRANREKPLTPKSRGFDTFLNVYISYKRMNVVIVSIFFFPQIFSVLTFITRQYCMYYGNIIEVN